MNARQILVAVLSRARKAGYPCSATFGWIGIANAHGQAFSSKTKAKKWLIDRYLTCVTAPRPAMLPGPCKITRPSVSVKPVKEKPRMDVNSPEFLASFQWRSLRMKVLSHYGRRCMCCGASPDNGVVMHVDHIKPRRLFPHLALDFDNLQVLCEVCNHGKGNHDHTDWRPAEGDYSEQSIRQLLRDIAGPGHY